MMFALPIGIALLMVAGMTTGVAVEENQAADGGAQTQAAAPDPGRSAAAQDGARQAAPEQEEEADWHWRVVIPPLDPQTVVVVPRRAAPGEQKRAKVLRVESWTSKRGTGYEVEFTVDAVRYNWQRLSDGTIIQFYRGRGAETHSGGLHVFGANERQRYYRENEHATNGLVPESFYANPESDGEEELVRPSDRDRYARYLASVVGTGLETALRSKVGNPAAVIERELNEALAKLRADDDVVEALLWERYRKEMLENYPGREDDPRREELLKRLEAGAERDETTNADNGDDDNGEDDGNGRGTEKPRGGGKSQTGVL